MYQNEFWQVTRLVLEGQQQIVRDLTTSWIRLVTRFSHAVSDTATSPDRSCPSSFDAGAETPNLAGQRFAEQVPDLGKKAGPSAHEMSGWAMSGSGLPG